jgi:hypothetical protein
LIIKPMSRLIALGLAVAVAGLAATPAQAGGPASPTFPRKATSGPLMASAEARLARLDTADLAAQASPATASAGSDHKPFFKTGKGIAVIVLFVAGTAWTLASASDKRIHSPIR